MIGEKYLAIHATFADYINVDCKKKWKEAKQSVILKQLFIQKTLLNWKDKQIARIPIYINP